MSVKSILVNRTNLLASRMGQNPDTKEHLYRNEAFETVFEPMDEQLPSFGLRGAQDLEPSKVLREEPKKFSKLTPPNYYKSPVQSAAIFPLNSSKI